ncbi:MAG: hypothetical protein ACH350_04920 [Parachlamydiaceae bacterium]
MFGDVRFNLFGVEKFQHSNHSFPTNEKKQDDLAGKIAIVVQKSIEHLQEVVEEEDELFGDYVVISERQEEREVNFELIEKKIQGSEDIQAGLFTQKQSIEEGVRKQSRLESLKNRKQTAVEISRIRDRFSAHVAWGILERKKGDKTAIHTIAQEHVDLVENILLKNGLHGFQREDLKLCMLGTLALVANADPDRKLYRKDIEQANEKANHLLKPQLKDKNGEKIKDEKFNLIKEEIKKNLIIELTKMKLIDHNDVEKSESQEKPKKSTPIDLYHANWKEKTHDVKDHKQDNIIVLIKKKSFTHQAEFFLLYTEISTKMRKEKLEKEWIEHDRKVINITHDEIKRMSLKLAIVNQECFKIIEKLKYEKEIILNIDGKERHVVLEQTPNL